MGGRGGESPVTGGIAGQHCKPPNPSLESYRQVLHPGISGQAIPKGLSGALFFFNIGCV